MIHINRSSVACPGVLDLSDPNSGASKEKTKAIAYYEDQTSTKKPKFSVYRNDSVKLALNKLFNGKCAYCESPLNAVSARDIEHFRPKGQIDLDNGQKPLKPGYYWLAADWDNLFLSCPACNQRQRQLVRDENGELILADEATGKKDLFPFRDGVQVARKPDDDLSQEEPYRLLLNPCEDKPEKHLRFDEEGNAIPKSISGKVSDRASTSIYVYQLKRITLVEERKAQYLQMVAIWDNIELAGQMINTLNPNQKQLVAAGIRMNEKRLLGFIDEGQPYTSTARCLIRPFVTKLREIKREYKNRFGNSI